MTRTRSAGILLPIASLPGPYGIGDLGCTSHDFLDTLRESSQRWWQILPLGPSPDGNPYVAQSSWAGSPFLISLEALVEAGDLTHEDLATAQVSEGSTIDYEAIARTRRILLRKAGETFLSRGNRALLEDFARKEATWLDEWALFAAIREVQDARPWWQWPEELRQREPKALETFRTRYENEILQQKYLQFRFFEQWDALRKAAEKADVGLIGDLPIYCARDSADVWAHPQGFKLDSDGHPTVVSGVPPDFFAEDGQRWGTPVYDWETHRKEGFRWWLSRLRGSLRLVHRLRIDHFRAFESYWEIPADAESAKEGEWVEGPGDTFFAAVKDEFGDAPFIAEDLGIITEKVTELRKRWELPGMRVLQFAFASDASNEHLPFHHDPQSVVYTGTHDNDTTVGWYASATEEERDYFRRLTATDGGFCHYHMMRLAYASVADLAVIPAQDVLGLDARSRINTPGTIEGNWRWKLMRGQFDRNAVEMLKELTWTFGRDETPEKVENH